MGSALQRLEILLIGLVLLIAGAIVAILMIVRPVTPAASVAASPQSVATLELDMPTNMTALSTSAPAPTPALIATEAPISALTRTNMPIGGFTSRMLAIVPWPLLILTVGLIGLPLALRHLRRRRMPYTNQNVSQLLAVADAETRATNVRVMRNLAQQGVLPAELAAAAGIVLPAPKHRRRLRLMPLALPHVSMPHVTFPALRFPTLHLPTVPRRRAPRPLTIGSASSTAPHELSHQSTNSATARDIQSLDSDDAPLLADNLSLSWPSPSTTQLESIDRLSEARVIEVIELPESEVDGDTTSVWTAEDRVLAATAALAALWTDKTIRSTIMAIDTPTVAGQRPVLIALDKHPDEELLINQLPELIVAQHPTWRANWRRDLLEILIEESSASVMSGGLLIAPVLTHGRSGKIIRFYPLSTWRHLGIYGGDALGALHALLSSLLYIQSPAELALAILDHGQITPLYRDLAHLVALPDDPRATIEILAQAIRRSAHDAVRPLMLVVVEPDDDALRLLIGIAARLQARPATPLHLIVVQEHMRADGRELYALLPALITSGGRGSSTLLPGQGDWPKHSDARLIGRGIRVEGQVITLDETNIAAHLAPLRGQIDGLPPVLWDAPAPGVSLETSAHHTNGREPDQQRDDATEHATRLLSVGPEQRDAYAAERKRRITLAMTNRRQALMDAEMSLPHSINDKHAHSADSADTNPDPETALAPTGAEDVTIDARMSEAALIEHQADTQITTEAATRDTVIVEERGSDLAGEHAHNAYTSLFRMALDAGKHDAPSLSARLPRRNGQRTGQLSAPAVPLSTTIEQKGESPAEHPIREPENGWPSGPAPLGRVVLAELMARVVSAPAIIVGQANELGVTKNRLVELLKGTHKAEAKELAELLLVWFDQAGLLVEPTKPGRLRHPRALITTDLAAIAAMLNKTTCPSKDLVMALWAESHQGRS